MPSQSEIFDLNFFGINGSSIIEIRSLKTLLFILSFRKLIPFTIDWALLALNKFLRRLEETFESNITSDLQVFNFLEFNFFIAFCETSFPIFSKSPNSL